MTKKVNRKSSARRKLIPAVGMLTVSAMMLSSATYAWFTMSREVEVKNIQMTATVPEDLQISLGEITDGSETNSLAKGASVLAQTSNVVNPPADRVDADPFDWSNTVDITKYYQFGKLIPASSTNGATVYYTADAAGNGKTLKTGATASATTDSATAHIYTTNSGDGWLDGTGNYAETGKYVTASAYDTTNDDGYYIDIPIWLRTSSTSAPDIFVTGFVKKGTNTSDTDTDNLYKAVRVAVLTDANAATNGAIDLNDGSAYPANIAANTSIIDSGIADSIWGTTGPVALKAEGTIAAASYDTVSVNTGATKIGTLTANDGAKQYGAMTKFVLRVWLEGEDENCWNANAGQDWDISLKFMTSALPANTGSGNG